MFVFQFIDNVFLRANMMDFYFLESKYVNKAENNFLAGAVVYYWVENFF